MMRRNQRNPSKSKKISDDDFCILNYNEFNNLILYNYNLSQLKEFTKYYKLKKSGNKKELTDRVFNFLRNSYYIIKIQSCIRKFFCKLSISLRGPALFNKNISTNDSDFSTLDKLDDIPFYEFISWRENDNIFSANIYSLKELISKSAKQKCFNPYNRTPISDELKNTVIKLLKLNKIHNYNYINQEETNNQIVINKQFINNKFMDICLRLDFLGNYTDINWFKTLNRRQILKFINVLYDIWNYRAQIPESTKRDICHPHGRPFLNVNLGYNFLHNSEILEIQYNFIKIIENFINKAINDENASLGAMYVLSSITLVNEEAAQALPWLFQSVAL